MSPNKQTAESAQQLAARLVRPEIAALVPYASARREASGGRIWLNANESPWNNSPIDNANRYPDCQPASVRNAYANYAGITPDQVLISRGADEAIDLLFRAFCRPNQDTVASCGPSYGMYGISAATNAVAYRQREWAEGYQLPVDFAEHVADCKLVFVCNPNNPSGTLIAPEQLRTLAQQLPNSLLVVDEAYIDFCPEYSVTRYLATCPNLVILRTLSKAFALAGARCGFTLAHPEIIQILEKVIAPYPVPEPVAQLAARALSEQGLATMRAQVAELNARRDQLSQQLLSLPQITQVLPSYANFLLFKLDEAQACYQHLIEQGLFIRAYRNHPALQHWLRISIGHADDIAQVLQALTQTAPQDVTP